MFLRLLFTAALLAVSPVRAAPAEDSGSLDSLRRAISDTENDLLQKRQAQQKTQQTLDKTRAALAKARQELAGIDRRSRDAEQRLHSLQGELESLKAETASGKAQLARLIGGQYKNRQNNAVILFLKNAEPGRKARYLQYARRIGEANRQVVARLVSQQQQMQQHEAEIDAELAKLEALKKEKQAALAKLGKTRAAAQGENSRLNADIARQNDKLAKLKSDEARLNQVLADIARRNAAKRRQEAAARAKAARERLAAAKKTRPAAPPAAGKADPAAVLEGRSGRPSEKPPAAAQRPSEKPAPQSPPPESTLTAEDRALQGEYADNGNLFSKMQGRLPHPASGAVSGRFGQARSGGGVWHGQLFATAPAPVRSVAAGTVAYAGNLGENYGNTVVVDHGGGYTTIYTGLSAVSAANGASVREGTVLGTSGSAFGEQGLYFEIRYRQRAMNPAAWLR
ncbi:peptidase M23B [Neisseria bacilliformis ATCC BAA-1200]|uniref:Peptidase M23B n=1 Tax=Neisseria bacilliformis ATCC BAA-1200 TaxID=888742 RepID=F2BEN1_9NEIS|nr:peptidoglycan DD-metalloendopeptidase family protein [Neisseria bacilliformis]EGF09936.1 peptidase M23B [Neisseria bacilliformis ATCC BAA-1200]QMT46859.1 peptidoglycan DD-metalloendopeptidase family protein [Neisseria bacilliformis]